MKEATDSDALSPEVHDIMRNLVSAIKTVKLYPPNNPVYDQSVRKSYETLSRFLKSSPEYHAGVQKTFFTYQHTPVGKEAQLNRAIAQDLFAKGIREIVFSAGLTEAELKDFCRCLALSSEELAMKSGISSILWEKGTEHIRVTEAGLDGVIDARTEGVRTDKDAFPTSGGVLDPAVLKKKIDLAGRTLVLGDIMTDPSMFGASMVELAKQTKAEHESVEDRLYALYQEAGRKIQNEHAAESDAMFEGLAKSVLALEQTYREGFIGGKLYGELDAEMAEDQEADQYLPNALHEVQTGRFSSAWSVNQVAVLLKKSAARKATPASLPPARDALEAVPISQDLIGITKDLAEYSPEEMAELKALGAAGMESDIIDAAVRTLIFLIPLVKSPRRSAPDGKDITRFSAIIRQLEDMLSYVLQNRDYDHATRIIRAFHLPVDPAFKPRLREALTNAASKNAVIAAIEEMRTHPKSSPQYQSAYGYVSLLEREATEALLELLAEEKDRSVRFFYLDLIKDLGKNQIALLGEHLTDGRWYHVRNIVSILAESKAEQVIMLLRKVANHNNIRIRQEVVKGLPLIGGKKAASVLAKFLGDKDVDVRLMAIRAFVDFPRIGAEEANPLIEFLKGRPIRKNELEQTLEAIKSLGKTGGQEAADFLQGYTRIRWWKPRKLQNELRRAALQAIEEIQRRKVDVGRTE